MRRGTPELLVATLIALLLGWYLWYTRSVVIDLHEEAKRTSQMFGNVYRGLNDSTAGAQLDALLNLSEGIRGQKVPLIWTDRNGKPAGHANLPFDPVADDDPRVRNYIAVLAAQNPPVVDTVVGARVYYGEPPLVRGLRIIPALQVGMAVILLLAGFYIIRTRGHAARERLWAGMARESAHQLGTPLSSLSGWIELMEERGGDESTLAAMTHMRGDLERLDRVAHRFERIGREPKLEEIDVPSLVERVVRYFRARVPTLANTVTITSDVASDLPVVHGDSVLLEWALEVLIKNAIDALAGRGGTIHVSARARPGGGLSICVVDDGPGVPRELRSRVFEPGFSTKKTGWGIGLSLAKRIVEENHGGKLTLKPAERGATFEIILQNVDAAR